MRIYDIEVKIVIDVEAEIDADSGQLETARPAMTPAELYAHVREILEDSCADEIQEQINESLGEQVREYDD